MPLSLLPSASPLRPSLNRLLELFSVGHLVVPTRRENLGKDRANALNTNARIAALNPPNQLLFLTLIVILARLMVLLELRDTRYKLQPLLLLSFTNHTFRFRFSKLCLPSHTLPIGHRIRLARVVASLVPVESWLVGVVACQRLDAVVNQTCEFIIYHTSAKPPLRLQLQVISQMQLSAYPTLMTSLELTESSWFDLFIQPAWKTMQTSTIFAADNNHPALIRLRPSLRIELELDDCFNIDQFITQQPRKCTGSFLVSPPKKTARTDTATTPSQARQIFEIPDSPPPSRPPNLPPSFPTLPPSEPLNAPAEPLTIPTKS
ncbi:hypothetical protein C8R44DRAFT_882558 [Mycena epipterygia]|nr:hypothetical protein C8R44DRAFT_882558 [Mycena epipterygia]